MNIYLSINNREEEIQIPVLPSSFQVGSEYSNSRIETVTHDEIMHIGNKRLTSIAFSSFFPVGDYPFIRSREKFGWDYINILGKWRDRKIPIRLIITNTSINVPVVITSFEYSVQDGTGDIYYTLGLEEYKFIPIQSIEAVPIAKPKPIIVEEKKKSTKKSPTSGKYSSGTSSSVQEKAKANKIIQEMNSSTKYVSKLDRIEELNSDKTKKLTYDQRNQKLVNDQKKLAEKKKSEAEKNIEQIKANSGTLQPIKKNAWERYEDWSNTTTGYIKDGLKKAFSKK